MNLFEAIKNADLEMVRTLIDRGADLDEIDINEYQSTPLAYACERGEEEIVALFLEKGADVSFAAFASPLVTATTYGFTSIVGQLIEAGADVDSANEEGQTALWLAAAQNFLEIARLLVEQRALIDLPDFDGKIPSVVAEENGFLGMAAYLNNPADFPVSHSLWNEVGQAERLAAAQRREQLSQVVEVAEELPWSFSKGMATLKMEHGTVTQDFPSVASSGNLEVVRAMLDSGLNPDWVMFRGGATALLLTARTGELEVLELLLERGADVHATDSKKQTALHMALMKPSVRRHAPVIERLLAAGADPNCMDEAGQCPLHMAIRHQMPALVQLLIEAGGDPFLRDQGGLCPADWLPESGKGVAEIRRLLEKAGQGG